MSERNNKVNYFIITKRMKLYNTACVEAEYTKKGTGSQSSKGYKKTSLFKKKYVCYKYTVVLNKCN